MGKLHIMVGVSGSGKSTKVAELIGETSGSFCVASADHYFNRDGEYQFNPAELKWAHQWCQGKVAYYMKREAQNIFLDNTNVVQEHIRPYLEMANHFEYDVVYHKLHEELNEEQLKEFAGRNKHGVPLDAIKRQYNRFKENWI